MSPFFKLIFFSYLGLYVVEGRRADDGEADQKDVSLGIRQRPKSIIVFLAGGIPQPEAYRLAINHHTRRVVVEPIHGAVVSDTGVSSPSLSLSLSVLGLLSG